VYQSKRLIGTDEGVLVCEGIGNRSHSAIGMGAFLVFQECDTLCRYRCHLRGASKVVSRIERRMGKCCTVDGTGIRPDDNDKGSQRSDGVGARSLYIRRSTASCLASSPIWSHCPLEVDKRPGQTTEKLYSNREQKDFFILKAI